MVYRSAYLHTKLKVFLQQRHPNLKFMISATKHIPPKSNNQKITFHKGILAIDKNKRDISILRPWHWNFITYYLWWKLFSFVKVILSIFYHKRVYYIFYVMTGHVICNSSKCWRIPSMPCLISIQKLTHIRKYIQERTIEV